MKLNSYSVNNKDFHKKCPFITCTLEILCHKIYRVEYSFQYRTNFWLIPFALSTMESYKRNGEGYVKNSIIIRFSQACMCNTKHYHNTYICSTKGLKYCHTKQRKTNNVRCSRNKIFPS